MRPFLARWETLAWSIGILAGSVVLGLIVRTILFTVARRLARRTPTVLKESFLHHSRRMSRWILSLFALALALPAAPLPEAIKTGLQRLVGLALIASYPTDIFAIHFAPSQFRPVSPPPAERHLTSGRAIGFRHITVFRGHPNLAIIETLRACGMNERRGSQRHHFGARVILTDVRAGVNLEGGTGDLSRSGCFVEMLNTLPQGAEIRIRILREDDEFTALGIVTSSIPKLGMGITFTTVEPSQADVLQKWLGIA